MTIEELHDGLYDLLLEVDRICRKNELRYFVAYGTAIGAVREKDFIPWDDDMDMMVLAEDYPRFAEVMRRELPSYLHLIEPQDFSPYFYDYTIRIIDDRFLLRKETDSDRAYKNYQNHLGVDVFVAAGCPEGQIGRKILLVRNKILYGMAMQFRFSPDYAKYTAIQKAQVCTLRLMGKAYAGKDPKKIIDQWFRLMRRYDAKETGWRFVINALLLPHYQKAMPDAWFHGEAFGEIRGKKVPLIGGYDEFLTLIYGAYRIPEKNADKYITHLDNDNNP